MPTPTVSILPASDVNFTDLVNTFNLAYSDYLVPLQLTPDQMRHTHEQTDIDLRKSRIALMDGQIVGMGFLATREYRAWVGGMGVIPDYRGFGIGRQLLSALLDEAKNNKIRTVQLEVIETNTPAYTLYTDIGFKKVRRLLIVVSDSPAQIQINTPINQVDSTDALANYDKLHTTVNPWQRECLSLSKAQDLTGWIISSNNEISSYVVGRITDRMFQIMDIGFAEGEDVQVQELLTHIHNQKPGIPASMVNLAEDDPAWRLMQAMGYSERLAQIEMIYQIAE